MSNIYRLFNTVKYLKYTQIYYRLYYLIRKKLRKTRGFIYPLSISSHSKPLNLNSISSDEMFKTTEFTFLNRSHAFDEKIDWNYSDFGKLWTYNLTYFEYLNQKELPQERGLKLIYDFIKQIKYVNDGMEPYPISLRGINWIKFLTKFQIHDHEIDNSLYAQYKILIDNLEYHLLGNHLLENGFSLLFAAYYFQDDEFYIKAKKILTDELNEQILKDGAHFELSPMYHQIILFRTLDSINLMKHNQWKRSAFLELLETKARLMFNWLNTITFNDGAIPLFNDSANNIAPTTKVLNKYAYSLNRKFAQNLENTGGELSESGYRKIKNDKYELVADVGNIGPEYIPGHAHSDTFSFELHILNRPFIVDTGISTYEANAIRQIERSTSSHNTVEIDSENQSDVWGGFRVAQRAKITQIYETDNLIEATHDGYKNRGFLHTRKFIFKADGVSMYDETTGSRKCTSIAYLHFHPEIDVSLSNTTIFCNNISIKFVGANAVSLEPYHYAPEFNKTIESKCAKILFDVKLETHLSIK